MIRVLHISRNFHPHAGGTEEFIASLARHTSGLGVESSVLCTDRHPDGEAPAPEIPVVRVPTVGPDRLQIARHLDHEAREALRAADLVHLHDLRFGLDLPRRARLARTVPRVLSTHGLIFHTGEHASVKRVAWRWMYLPALRRLDAVVADSMHDYESVSDLPNARMIENPVDVDDFVAIADVAVEPDGPLVYFGRLAPNKGIERLVPVLEHDPSLRLVVVGTGDASYVDSLRRAFDGLAFELAGSVSRAEVVARLRGASVIVLPSLTEGFGITLVEAMATGRPVVASDIAPYRALTADSGVRLADFDDPAAVLDAVRAAGAAGHQTRSVQRARSFSWESRAPQFVALYEQLLTERSADA